MESQRALTPTQQRLVEQMRRDAEPLVFAPTFVDDLIERAREGFADLSAALGGEKLWVSKHFVTRALGCEALHLAPDPFEWTTSNARGSITHKAVELFVNWRGEPVPALVVDEAIARLAGQPNSLGDWLARLGEADLAELRGYAVERFTRFVQDFPPLDMRAEPITEAAGKWRASQCIELSGRADLVIGRPEGTVSKRLIVDFKTGSRSPQHRLDLRFYALVETLQRSVPPRKLVTYYFDYAEAEVEQVTEGILDSALDRALGAVARHAELVSGERTPVKRPSYSCRWCPLLADCTEGTAHLAALADDGSQGFDD
jgi:RecB family exonuclease